MGEHDRRPGGHGADRVLLKEPSDIPYRSLVPIKVENLLVAGRCLSSEFMAQAAARLVLTCVNMGQAAGTAMAQSPAEGTSPRKIDVRRLRAILAEDRAWPFQAYECAACSESPPSIFQSRPQ